MYPVLAPVRFNHTEPRFRFRFGSKKLARISNILCCVSNVNFAYEFVYFSHIKLVSVVKTNIVMSVFINVHDPNNPNKLIHCL